MLGRATYIGSIEEEGIGGKLMLRNVVNWCVE
jgi:hypothetical protein